MLRNEEQEMLVIAIWPTWYRPTRMDNFLFPLFDPYTLFYLLKKCRILFGGRIASSFKKMEFTMYLHLSTITTSYEVFIIFPYFVLTPDKIQEHIRQSYIAICRAYCAGVSYYRSFKLPTLSFCSNFKQFMNLFQLDILFTLDLN